MIIQKARSPVPFLIGPIVELIKSHILKLSKKHGTSTFSCSALSFTYFSFVCGCIQVQPRHTSGLTATTSREVTLRQVLDEPLADVIPFIITKILEVETIISSLYKRGNREA